MNPDDFVQSLEQAGVTTAIQKAEEQTSGEIRVYVAQDAEPDPLKAARLAFTRLGMDRTQDRNGVLILVAPLSQTFAIVGDQGVDKHCGPEFWSDIASEMGREFAAGRPAAGIQAAIESVGDVLSEHFPRRPDDANELPDSIATG